MYPGMKKAKLVNDMPDVSHNITWTDDPSLPDGWMISSGTGVQVIKSKSGAVLMGRKEAIDNMIKEHYSPTDICRLWNTLDRDGWISDDENLPAGWKKKFFPSESKHHYLSPMMEVVTSSIALLDLVKNSKDYSQEELRKVEHWKEKENL